jgi:YVTN family beta-propeller protein
VTNNVVYSNGAPATVTVVDINTRSIIGTIQVGQAPNSVAVDPASGRAYVTNIISKSVSVIDTAANRVIATVPLPNSPAGVATTGSRAYVSTDGVVEVISIPSNNIVASIPVGRDAVGVAVTSGYVFVANQSSNTVNVINVTTNSVEATLYVGNSPTGVAVYPATNSVYVTNQDDRTISVIQRR